MDGTNDISGTAEARVVKFCAQVGYVTFKHTYNKSHIFTARAYARALLGVVILSVHSSVCLSHAWIVTKLNDALRIF